MSLVRPGPTSSKTSGVGSASDAEFSSEPKGRVLVIGSSVVSSPVINRLTRGGFVVRLADQPERVLSVSAQLRPEAVLFTSGGARERRSLSILRRDAALSQLPMVGDLSSRKPDELRRLKLDDWVYQRGELIARMEGALTARRLVERDLQARLRMEMLLEITHAATSSLELNEILSIAVEKIARVIAADRCSIVLVEGESPRLARVVASQTEGQFKPLEIDLGRYPELRRALETRRGVHVEDVARDPLMAEVRNQLLSLGVKSVLVEPLICQDDLVGALFLRLSRGGSDFGRDELEFARAAAGALANSVRNARLHNALRRKRDDLEFAYVERYRELNEANRRLRDLNRVKDEMIAICSHDLRSPLNVLLGHGRMLVESRLPPHQAASAEAILRQTKKVLELVESLLERGSLEKQSLTLEARPLDISELCKEVTRELEIIASSRMVTLRAETPESLSVLGDPVKLQQVLQNIITNGIRYSKKGGLITVLVARHQRPDGDEARVVVQDSGAGIPKDQLHTVFDRYRAGPGGVGLGLAICKQIVELHGGEIWAELPGSGGTRVMFTLPLLKTSGQAPAPSSTAETETAEHRVLVVEDEPDVAAVVAEILRSRYRVEIARDGAEGLAKARANHPDLILMDVFLPKLDGLDAALALKSSSETASIPVVFLSAQQAVADKVRALNLGAVDYLAKPFQALELLACADRAIRLHKTQTELERSKSLIRRAGNDPETGLLNREGFIARYDQEASRSRRYDRALCLALLRPLSPMKNEARAIASVIRRRLRAPDVLAYLGDGVFLLMMPESTPESASVLLDRLVSELMDEYKIAFKSAALDGQKGGVPLNAALDQLLGSKGLLA